MEEFDTGDNIKMIIGVMVALIVAATVMIPVFSDIEAQILYNKNNVGSVAYAEAYTAGQTDISIEIDATGRTITTNGETVPLTASRFCIVVGSDFLVEYQEGGGSSLSVTAILRTSQSVQQTVYEAEKIYGLTGVQISSDNTDIEIMLNAEGQGYDERIYTYESYTEKVYYLSNDGPYGFFDRTALQHGVNVNDRFDTQGFLTGPAEARGGYLSSDHEPSGFWSAYSTGLRTNVFVQRFQPAGVFGYYYADRMEDAAITGSVTEHGEYSTIKIESVTYTDREITGTDDAVSIQGIYLIAPLSYYTGEIEHAGMLVSILWILPVLVFVALAVAIVERIRMRRTE